MQSVKAIYLVSVDIKKSFLSLPFCWNTRKPLGCPQGQSFTFISTHRKTVTKVCNIYLISQWKNLFRLNLLQMKRKQVFSINDLALVLGAKTSLKKGISGFCFVFLGQSSLSLYIYRQSPVKSPDIKTTK